MQINKNTTKLLSLGIISMALSGCSLVYFPYFRNYADKPVQIIFKKNSCCEKDTRWISFKNEILLINKKTYKNLNDSLPLNIFPGDNDKVFVTAPPNSTILLPRWGVNWTNTILLRQGSRLDSISIFTNDGTINNFQAKSYGFPPVRLYYYDYK